MFLKMLVVVMLVGTVTNTSTAQARKISGKRGESYGFHDLAIKDIKATMDGSKLTMDVTFDFSKWPSKDDEYRTSWDLYPPTTKSIQVALYDENGQYLSAFRTKSSFSPHPAAIKFLRNRKYRPMTSAYWIPMVSRFVFDISKRDAEYVSEARIVFGFPSDYLSAEIYDIESVVLRRP